MTEPRRPRPPVQELQDIAYRAVSLLLLLQNRRLRATEADCVYCMRAEQSSRGNGIQHHHIHTQFLHLSGRSAAVKLQPFAYTRPHTRVASRLYRHSAHSRADAQLQSCSSPQYTRLHSHPSRVLHQPKAHVVLLASPCDLRDEVALVVVEADRIIVGVWRRVGKAGAALVPRPRPWRARVP